MALYLRQIANRFPANHLISINGRRLINSMAVADRQLDQMVNKSTLFYHSKIVCSFKNSIEKYTYESNLKIVRYRASTLV